MTADGDLNATAGTRRGELTRQQPMSLASERSVPFDIQPQYHALLDDAPVTKVTCPVGTDAWAVSRYQEVRDVLSDGERLSSTVSPAAHYDEYNRLESEKPPEANPGRFIRLDPPAHRPIRKLASAALSPRGLEAFRSSVSEIVDDRLDELAHEAQPVDLVSNFASVVASRSISQLFGVPEDERPDIQRSICLRDSREASLEDKLAAREFELVYLEELIGRKRSEPGRDLLSDLVANDATSADPLGDQQLAEFAKLLIGAGHVTTANQIALSIVTLLEHPDQLVLLRQRPELIPDACEELLRYLTIVQYGVPRRSVAPLEIAGQRIEQGEMVVALLSAANRDPRTFSDPDTLDVTRPRRDNRHVAFGFGAHICIGQHLARLELEVCVASILQRIPTLRLALPALELDFEYLEAIYGISSLPVAWDEILPRTLTSPPAVAGGSQA